MPIKKQPSSSAESVKDQPTAEQFLATFPPEKQALAEQLRHLIKQTIPNISEAVYSGWKLIGYREQDGRRGRYFCFVAPFANRVMLDFEYGVLMADAAGLLEGNGKQVRYVTLRSQADLRPHELSVLIAEAAMVAATRARSS
ncbi:MAG: DUF1801 domain-containing protein [Chloroflexota bacterium]|nr:DUF1801 domain-containing protein [Chloroflexota bacterium]